MNEDQKQPTILVEPDAWATKTECVGPDYGKTQEASPCPDRFGSAE